MKKGILAILCLTSLALSAEPEAKEGLRDITVAEAVSTIESNKELVLIDVRTPEEFAEGHLAGAQNIDVKGKEFETKLAKLDRTKSYLMHCRSGARGVRAMAAFKKLGFKNVLHMKDGYLGWTKGKQAVVK